jgi:hypothetical protein
MINDEMEFCDHGNVASRLELPPKGWRRSLLFPESCKRIEKFSNRVNSSTIDQKRTTTCRGN